MVGADFAPGDCVSLTRLDFDEPMPDLPMESRGPDGLAILRPATDAACDPITFGPATVAGDGVVFVRWSG